VGGRAEGGALCRYLGTESTRKLCVKNSKGLEDAESRVGRVMMVGRVTEFDRNIRSVSDKRGSRI
jgi:hypothetical protein